MAKETEVTFKEAPVTPDDEATRPMECVFVSDGVYKYVDPEKK